MYHSLGLSVVQYWAGSGDIVHERKCILLLSREKETLWFSTVLKKKETTHKRGVRHCKIKQMSWAKLIVSGSSAFMFYGPDSVVACVGDGLYFHCLSKHSLCLCVLD